MPHVTYAEQPFCPWPGCSFVIKGVDFCVEKIPGRNKEFLRAWYAGGIVGVCPGCTQYVHFTADGKSPVPDLAAAPGLILPDHWHRQAAIES